MSNRSFLQTWAQLLRLPNLFTVPGDAVVGAVLAGSMFKASLLFGAGSSLLLYMGGLLLNDYFDRDEDARERPDRPIPAGDAKPGLVFVVGLVMLVGGIGLPWFAGGVIASAVAFGVAVCVVCYDMGGRKISVVGPILMGLCRGGSVLLGAACFGHFSQTAMIAAGVTVFYTLTITVVAANETTPEKVGVSVILPAIVPFLVFAIGFPTGFLRGYIAILPGIIFVVAAWEIGRFGMKVVSRQCPVPAFIGRCIRVMLTMQLAWILSSYAVGTRDLIFLVIIVFVGVRVVADFTAKQFYGS